MVEVCAHVGLQAPCAKEGAGHPPPRAALYVAVQTLALGVRVKVWGERQSEIPRIAPWEGGSGLCGAGSREWGAGMKPGSPAAPAREVWGPTPAPRAPAPPDSSATRIKTSPAPCFHQAFSKYRSVTPLPPIKMLFLLSRRHPPVFLFPFPAEEGGGGGWVVSRWVGVSPGGCLDRLAATTLRTRSAPGANACG